MASFTDKLPLTKSYYDFQSEMHGLSGYNDFQQVIPGLFIGG